MLQTTLLSSCDRSEHYNCRSYALSNKKNHLAVFETCVFRGYLRNHLSYNKILTYLRLCWKIIFQIRSQNPRIFAKTLIFQKKNLAIRTSYPKIATNFQSFYLVEIFALLLWNLSWWLLLPFFRFSQIFIIFRQVVLEICDSSFLEFRKIRGPYTE